MKTSSFLAGATLSCVVAIACLLGSCSARRDAIPGTVVAYSPASSGKYIGSPSLLRLPDGVLLAKYDEFGPKSTEHESAVTHVYRSDNDGKSWRQSGTIQGLFWSGFFNYEGAAYLMGTDKHHGNVVITKSTDAGKTWSDTGAGVLLRGEYHTAPVPVVFHNGRVWRAMEDAMGGKEWGSRYRPFMMSAPIGANLLSAESWRSSNTVARDSAWLDGTCKAWLEGNVAVAPSGGIVDILRVQVPEDEKAALVEVSGDGRMAYFDPKTGFVDFPGGAKKFTIKRDGDAGDYWTLTNIVLPAYADMKDAGAVRNTVTLLRSRDLRSWEVRCIVLHHAEVLKHGFQYIDWLFSGNDIIMLSRTAYDDAHGGAKNKHDANFLTFHRIKNFRELTMKDSVFFIDTDPRKK